jgi:hypothetical protein
MIFNEFHGRLTYEAKSEFINGFTAEMVARSWHPVRRATPILYENCVQMTENQTAYGRLRA